MAFSMHSHSGEFCPGHARDTLEEVILTAIARGMKTFACTEHMPRESEEDLYPEEVAASHTVSDHLPLHAAYLTEAIRLRSKYASQITLLIAFEAEWIRPSYGPFISRFSSDPRIDFFIGSVHHVHGIPIDYDKTMYATAVKKSSSEEALWGDYYDAQFEMLRGLKPRVVGHFDLIRLLASDPNLDLKSKPELWAKAVRNLTLIKEQGALLEVNSAALRKGLNEPYPGRSICEKWIEMGGKFTLSDDSHGVAQVGSNYGRMFEYLGILGVEEVWTLERVEEEVGLKSAGMKEVRDTFTE